MLIYIVFFVFIAILAIQYDFTPFESGYLLFSIAILLGLLAGFRDSTVAKDYLNYQNLFDHVYELTANNFLFLLSVEPGFIGIVLFFRTLFYSNYGIAIMLFYALVSLTIKVFAIKRLSINPYLTLLFYFSYFFMFHEMTQIRIGLASGIFLISVVSLLNGKRILFIGGILLATCFHYSAIFYLGILLFSTTTFNRNFYIAVLILSLILGFIKLPLLNLLGNFDPSDIPGRLNNYIEMSQNGTVAVNVFNSLNIANVFCCIYLMFTVDKNTLISDKTLILFLKCNILAIFLLSFLAGAPAFSFRFNQLFNIAQIFVFTYLVKYLPAKKFNIFVVLLIAAFFFYVIEIYGGLLNPYKIIEIK